MRRQAILVLASGFLLVLASADASARVIYVDDDGPADCNSIQAAIDNANDGDVVVVYPGTYIGDGNRDLDFQGKAITVRSEDPNDPNIVAATIIDCNGSAEDPHRGFYFHSGEDANSVLEGFTITNGYGPNEPFAASTYSAGGAIYCNDSSPTIRKCVIRNNYAAYWGGGLWFSNSRALVTECTFKDNESGDTGGGLYDRLRGITVNNCRFIGNSAPVGGGMYNVDGAPIVRNSIFVGNSAGGKGGAVRNNRAAAQLVNCTFYGNSAPDAGAVHNKDSEGTIIKNSILWGNLDSEIEGPAEVTYCDVQGGWPGEGNIDAEPCFADPRNGDFHLLPDSPCIDAGDPNYVPSDGEMDIDNQARILDGRVDMGADEYVAILYVSAYSPNDPGSGTQEDPYRCIQDAVDAAVGGEEIHIGQGIYNEAVTIQHDLILYGGYDSNDWASPADPNANSTTITYSECDYMPVVSISDANVTIDRFTIQNGCSGGISCTSRKAQPFEVEISNSTVQDNSLAIFPYANGAGIYCDAYVRTIIVANTVRRNTIYNGFWTEVCGAGIYCAGSRTEIRETFVVDNSIICELMNREFGSAQGAGIWIGGGLVSNNTVARNHIGAWGNFGGGPVKGGGIYADSATIITGNTIADNGLFINHSETQGDPAEAYGAGIYAPNCVITLNTVSDNRCLADAGYVYPVSDFCFNGGTGSAYGGGIYAPSGTLEGNLVMANEAGSIGGWGWCECDENPGHPVRGGDAVARGGGIYAPGAAMQNNTVAGNRVVAAGALGYVCGEESNPWSTHSDPNCNGLSISEGAGVYGGDEITNTIIWANSPDELAGADCNNVAYCDIGDGVGGGEVGNISVDPCFADAEYHLQCDSPCVDAGDPMTPVGEEPFPNGGIINMGAYGGTAEAARSCFGGKLCETEVDGDINGDCRIDAMDLQLMVFHWIEDIPPSPPPCETIVAGDFNDDCDINFEDFCLMALHWCEDNSP